MNGKLIPISMAAMLVLGGCAETAGPRYGATTYGDGAYSSSGYNSSYNDARQPVAYTGYVSNVETFEVQPGYRFGVGSIVGAVAGGLLGSQVGEGSGKAAATIAGAAIGGAAGTAVESRRNKELASRVTVDLRGGGMVTIVQPADPQIQRGMRVAIVGSGESARVVPAA
jgi:outer membrane lipoprotein SlyB